MEDKRYSRDYLDPAKRSIANAVQVHFVDGTSTEKVIVEYPIGHRRRREEGIPLLERKFAANLGTRFPAKQCDAIMALCLDQNRLEYSAVSDFIQLFVI